MFPVLTSVKWLIWVTSVFRSFTPSYKIRDMSGETEGNYETPEAGEAEFQNGRWVRGVACCTALFGNTDEAFHVLPRGPRANVWEPPHSTTSQEAQSQARGTSLCKIPNKQATAKGQRPHVYGLTVDRYNECRHTDFISLFVLQREKKKVRFSRCPGVRVSKFQLLTQLAYMHALAGHHNDFLQSVITWAEEWQASDNSATYVTVLKWSKLR